MKHVIVVAFALTAIAAPVRAADTAAQLNAAELARLQSGAAAPLPMPAAGPGPMAAASACPPGTQWMPGSYVRKGKWRSAGCRRR
jgi:hypothetical protein